MGSALVASVIGEIRAAQQYLLTPSEELKAEFIASGDSAYAAQRRFRELRSLSNDERVTLNRIATKQAEIEVAYALAHALADVGRPDAALAQARAANTPADSLVGMVRTLTSNQASQAPCPSRRTSPPRVSHRSGPRHHRSLHHPRRPGDDLLYPAVGQRAPSQAGGLRREIRRGGPPSRCNWATCRPSSTCWR